MSPQEKADELFHKFYDYVPKKLAKQLSIIYVDQIIEELETLYVIAGSSAISDKHMYYKLVKSEIEKL